MNEHSKLYWRCRRGMKELDVLLQGYLEQHYNAASDEERCLFAKLLELEDPQLFSYLTGRETLSDAALIDVVGKIRSSANP